MVRLDRPAEAAAFRADPDAALGALSEPVLLDEWQEVPPCWGRSSGPSTVTTAPAGSC